jgi:hypothetical protein
MGIEQTLSFGQTCMSYLSGIIGPVSSITTVSFDSIPCNQPFYTSEYQQLSNYCYFKILLDSLRSISIVVNIRVNYSGLKNKYASTNSIFFINMWFMTPDIGARYVHIKPPRNPWENMGWSSIFEVLGAQQQEHLIDPLKGTTCHSKDLNLGGRVTIIRSNHPSMDSIIST